MQIPNKRTGHAPPTAWSCPNMHTCLKKIFFWNTAGRGWRSQHSFLIARALDPTFHSLRVYPWTCLCFTARNSLENCHQDMHMWSWPLPWRVHVGVVYYVSKVGCCHCSKSLRETWSEEAFPTPRSISKGLLCYRYSLFVCFWHDMEQRVYFPPKKKKTHTRDFPTLFYPLKRNLPAKTKTKNPSILQHFILNQTKLFVSFALTILFKKENWKEGARKKKMWNVL